MIIMIQLSPKTLAAKLVLDFSTRASDRTTHAQIRSANEAVIYPNRRGYDADWRAEGAGAVHEYTRSGARIVLNVIPEPGEADDQTVRHEWEFMCPHTEADVLISDLKFIYWESGFEVNVDCLGLRARSYMGDGETMEELEERTLPVVRYVAELPGFQYMKINGIGADTDVFKCEENEITLRTRLLSDESGFCGLDHDWRFDCPDPDARMYMEVLKAIYGQNGYQIDE
jgi:hypothetical protein